MPATRGPRLRLDCALGNYVLLGDTPVCFGLDSGAQHHARCPEARRLAWWRAVCCALYRASVVLYGLMLVALVVWVAR